MKLTRLFIDRRSTSSVIGIILIVALVVILSTTVGVFALGFGATTESPPTAAFEFGQSAKTIYAEGPNSADFQTVTLTHDGGDSLDESKIRVTVNGEPAWGVKKTIVNDGDCIDPPCHEVAPVWSEGGKIEAGSSVTIVLSGETSPAGTQIQNDTNLYIDSNAPYLIIEPDTINQANDVSFDPGDTVRVIWVSDEDGSTAILLERTIH